MFFQFKRSTSRPRHSKLHSSTVDALMCTRSWPKDEYERDHAVENNIMELEGCFTTLDIISRSDDEPVDIYRGPRRISSAY
ncbi:hypothetical protein LINPERPRIM_LOCUS12926 [Linum perenne]